MDTDTRTILVDDDLLGIAERMATTTARLEADFSRVETKIHRFPRSLREIGGDKDRYIVPSVVAIGPYHHGSPHLRKMEEVKLAAAYHLCRASGHSAEEVYDKVCSVAVAARGCYDPDDPAVVRLRDDEFAAMMFLDGCFLLQYMMVTGDDVDVDDMTVPYTVPPVLQNRMMLSTGPSIQKDIFLLENQIPWLVLELLMEFMLVDVHRFVAGMGEKFLPVVPEKERWKAKDGRCCRRGMHCGCIPMAALPKTTTRAPSDEESRGGAGSTERHKPPPPHLLGLLRFTQLVGRWPADVKNYREFPTFKSSNAVELAEVGVKLTPSTKPWSWHMSFQRRHLFGELSLSPVVLNDTTACWLVNLAALEEAASTSPGSGASGESGTYTVRSYLFMLATLMDREEEVQQMRSNYILYSTLSNKQALRFFKDLADRLRVGDPYFVTMEAISSYRRHVWIIIYRFIYKNYRTIAAVLSVAGVLCSILNALYSLKKPYKT